MTYLTKQYKFCAAHKYWNPKWNKKKNYDKFGDDIKLHGHNYNLDITISGPINPDTGFIIDLMELNRIVEIHVINILDHTQIEIDIKENIHSLLNTSCLNTHFKIHEYLE